MTGITSPEDRDSKTGRFLPGNSGFGGRPKGARSRLGEAFLEDLRDAWNAHGIEALRRCATEEPSQFVRVVAGLLPKSLDINMTGTIDVSDFATRLQNALDVLHEQERTIEHQP